MALLSTTKQDSTSPQARKDVDDGCCSEVRWVKLVEMSRGFGRAGVWTVEDGGTGLVSMEVNIAKKALV